MKNAIGLILFGLLLRYGSADVSHLSQSGHNHYLPPAIQNLPIEQDYNGIDSQPHNRGGFEQSHNGQHLGNRGYLPPYQNQQQHQDPYNPAVQVSYHNHYALHHPSSHLNNQPVQSHRDQTKNEHVHGNHDDGQTDDHVEIDQQQLEPVVPTNFENPAPAHSENQQDFPPNHDGYHYLPPAQPTASLYPNHGSSVTEHSSHGGPGNVIEHQREQQGYLPPSQSHSNHDQPEVSSREQRQGYLPPIQSSHENPRHPSGHSHQEPHDDYLPPLHNQLNHGIPEPNSDSNYHHVPQQVHHHSGHSHQGANQGYLPPRPLNNGNSVSLSNQIPQQDYLPPSEANHLNSAESVQQGIQLPQDYLSPVNDGSTNQHHQQTHHSNFNLHDHSGQSPNEIPNSSSEDLQIAPPRQQEPISHLTVRGHINVPLPIPQVGYFFVPGVVSKIPTLTEQQNPRLLPAINIPTIISPHQSIVEPTQRISSPEYTRTFLLQHHNHAAPQTSSGISIRPSIETLQNAINQDYLPPNQGFNAPTYQQQNHIHLGHNHHQLGVLQQNPQNPEQNLIDYLPPQPSTVSYPQNVQQNNIGHGFLPSLHNVQQHDNYQPQQNLNQVNNAHEDYIPPNKLANSGLSLQNIARSEVPNANNQQSQISQPLGLNNYQGGGYLPPANDQRSQSVIEHQDNPHNQQQNNYQNVNNGRGYLPPSQPENNNQVTSIQTYMSGVHPNDRYGSSQFHNPPPKVKGNPPPPIITPPPMYSKPTAIRAYAPSMAYRVTTPYNTFNPASYLPPVGNGLSQKDHNEQQTSIGQQLNEEARRNLAKIMPKDNTVFPLDELLDLQDYDIDEPQLMEQLSGRIRTVQIINNHANSVKNIKVLETADSSGVKTIKILGHSDEDPMGEHKVVRIVSKGPHPDGIVQTIKIYADHKEVTLPTQNAYIPPPKAKDNYTGVSPHSHETHRSH